VGCLRKPFDDAGVHTEDIRLSLAKSKQWPLARRRFFHLQGDPVMNPEGLVEGREAKGTLASEQDAVARQVPRQLLIPVSADPQFKFYPCQVVLLRKSPLYGRRPSRGPKSRPVPRWSALVLRPPFGCGRGLVGFDSGELKPRVGGSPVLEERHAPELDCRDAYQHCTYKHEHSSETEVLGK
jgi:hypothetical protein